MSIRPDPPQSSEVEERREQFARQQQQRQVLREEEQNHLAETLQSQVTRWRLQALIDEGMAAHGVPSIPQVTSAERLVGFQNATPPEVAAAAPPAMVISRGTRATGGRYATRGGKRVGAGIGERTPWGSTQAFIPGQPSPIRRLNFIKELEAERQGTIPPVDYNRWLREQSWVAYQAQEYGGWSEEDAWLISQLLADVADEIPSIWRVFEENHERAIRMTDEDLMAAFRRGEVGPQTPMEEWALDIMRATDDTWSTWAGSALYANSIHRDTLARQGRWEAGDLTFYGTAYDDPAKYEDPRFQQIVSEAAHYEVLKDHWVEMVRAGQLPTIRVSVPVGDDLNAPESWNTIAARPATWFTTEGGMLGLSVEIETAQGPIVSEFLVQLAEGTEVRDGHDAALALLQAFNGRGGHSLLQMSDIPGAQTLIGRAWESLGDVVRGFESTPISEAINGWWGELRRWSTGDPDYVAQWLNSGEIQAQEREAEATRIAQSQAAGEINEIEAVEMLIRVVQAQTPALRTLNLNTGHGATIEPEPFEGYDAVVAMSQELLSLSPEDRDDFISDIENIRAEDLQPFIEQGMRDRPVVGEMLAQGGEFLLKLATEYDKLVHGAAIRLFHLPTAIKETLEGNVRDENGIPLTGWDAFYESATDIDATYLSEYWGIEGTAAFWTDLSASIFFDPLTWATPGAAGMWQWAKSIASNPGLAPLAIRKFPALRHAAREILNRNNVSGALLFSKGMSGAGIRRLMEMAGDPLMRWNQTGIEEFSRVVINEMSNTGWMPHSATRATTIRTVEGIAQTFGGWQRRGWTNAGRSRVANMLLNLSQHRGITITPDDWLDEFVDLAISAFPRDQQGLLGVMRRALSVYDQARALPGSQASAHIEGAIRSTLRDVRRANRALRMAQPAQVLRYQQTREGLQLMDNMIWDMEAELDRFYKGAGVKATRRAAQAKAAARGGHITNRQQALNLEHNLDEFRRSRDTHQAELDLWAQPHEAYQQERAALRGRIVSLRRSIDNLENPINPQPIVDFQIEFMDEWAERILRRKGFGDAEIWASTRNKLHSNPRRRLINWSLIHDPEGRFQKGKRLIALDESNLDFWAPMYTRADGTIDNKLRKTMLQSGFYLQMGSMPLPASPWELVAFDNMPDRHLWNKFIYSKPMLAGRRNIQTGLQRLTAAFSFDVLMNLITPIRTGLDEPLRYLADTGDWMGFLKAVGVSVPGVGRLMGESRISKNPWAWAYMRSGNNPNLYRNPRWVWIHPGEKGHPQAAERWLTGQARHIEPLQQWARAVRSDNRDLWRAWYENEWLTRTVDRTRAVLGKTGVGRREISAREMYQTIENGLDTWLEGMIHGKTGTALARATAERDHARRVILQCWADNMRFDEILGPDSAMALLRKLPAVPGERFVGTSGYQGMSLGAGAEKGANFIGDMMDSMWDTLYGGPQRYRQGIFFDGYNRWMKDVLNQRFSGRVIDTAWVMNNLPNVTSGQAASLIRNPSAVLRQAAADAKFVFPSQIEAWSARWSRRHADDLMYQFVASSLFGTNIRKFYNPYARAGTDFVRWWLKKLFEPATLGLSPNARRALQVTQEAIHPVRAARNPAGALSRIGRAGRYQPTGMTRQPGMIRSGVTETGERLWSMGSRSAMELPIPFNLRLWSRFAHVFSAEDRERDMEAQAAIERGEDPDRARAMAGRNLLGDMWGYPDSPLGTIKAFSFFPDDMRADDLLLDFAPQPGFIPVSILLGISELLDADEDHPVRRWLEDLFPALGFYDTSYLNSLTALGDLIGPVTGRSNRGFGNAIFRLAYRHAGAEDDGWAWPLAQIVGATGMPPGALTRSANAFGDWLATNGLTVLPVDEDWGPAMEQIYWSGVEEANVAFGQSRVLNVAAPLVNSRIPAEAGYIRHYAPIIEALPQLVEAYLVTPADAEQLMGYWRRWENTGQSGNQDLSDRELESLAASLADIYYGSPSTVQMTDQMIADYQVAYDQSYTSTTLLTREDMIRSAASAAGIPAIFLADMNEVQLHALDEEHRFEVSLPQWLRDEWLVTSGLAVNVVSKLRAYNGEGQIPDIPDEYARFFYPDGRLNNTELMKLGYEEASQVRAEMLARHVLGDRVMFDYQGNGWAEEAQRVMLDAARRIAHREWRHVTETLRAQGFPGEDWKSQQSGSYLAAVYAKADIPAHTVEMLELLMPDGLPDTFTGEWLRTNLGNIAGNTYNPEDPLRPYANLTDKIALHTEPGGVMGGLMSDIFSAIDNAMVNTPEGRRLDPAWRLNHPNGLEVTTGSTLLDRAKTIRRYMEDEYGVSSTWEYPEFARRIFREQVWAPAISRGWITMYEYQRSGAEREFGPIGVSLVPELRTEEDLVPGTSFICPNRETINNRLRVVDGDTIEVYLNNTSVTVRLQGVNAPDEGQPGYEEATQNLRRLIYEIGDRVTLGWYQPDVYGTYQLADATTGDVRLKMFLMVDGVPIVDENTYTTSSPGGVRAGVPFYVPDILGIYNLGRAAPVATEETR